MANRVLSDEVKAIVTTAKSDVTTPFIDSANLLVTEYLASSGLSDERLKLIELYLSAHLVSLSEGGEIISRRTGEAEERYNPFDAQSGFSMTRFGQQAIALDSTGALAALAAPPLKAQFRVM